MKVARLLMTAATAMLMATPALANGPEVKTPHVHSNHHMMDHVFDKMDTNHDGVVSKDEWMAHQSEEFDEIDTSHDGRMSKNEFRAEHGKMEKKRMSWMRRDDNDRDRNHAILGREEHRMPVQDVSPSSGQASAGRSTSAPPANNEAMPNRKPGGADGAGGCTAQ